ncbi:toll/interleukin-1 receptor domain-containing protein [Streptomyces sp. NRRL F-5755]|uniref:toll/interleukin-1 receptor domain-containing protein n=1 Tax=Streptomyces sp. NRRL F-5755 TaxID=1519475 RepID=UPI000ADA5741|nr:toll/interleukin-1 receptor domain-containing protein [Streptomyces sp. NRRL F-5755]
MRSNSAPRVFVSYSHDSNEHRQRVLGLIQALRRNGIDAWADFFEESKPPAMWPAWMRTQVGEADYVLTVITETYARRYNQQEEPGIGAGVRWEATLITADIYFSTSKQIKYIPVVFSAEDTRHIPPPLNLTNKYLVVPDDDSSLLPLLRHLLQAPEFVPAQLGEAPDLPSSDGVPTADPAIEPRIASALQLSKQNPTKAIDTLTALLDSLRGSQRAAAYCAIGEINQRMGFWAPALTAYQRALESNPDKTTAEVSARNLRAALAGMETHFRDGGPVDTANKFVQAVKKNKMDRAWNLLTPTLRLVLAQAWVWANKDHPNLAPYNREELAKSLSTIKPTHKLTKDFMATQLGEFKSSFSSIDETWGAASNPRPIGIDYELVVLSPTGGDIVIFDERTGPIQTSPFLMKQTMGQWRVHSFSPAYPIPGWPPSREEIPAELSNYVIAKPTGARGAKDD